MLVRRVLAASFEWARTTTTAPAGGAQRRKKEGRGAPRPEAPPAGRKTALLAVLREWPFDPTGDLSKMPVGLRLHVLDIWVDELERAGFLPPGAAEGEDDVAEEAREEDGDEDREFVLQLRALVESQLKSPSKPVRARAKESLADGRLPWNRGRGAGDDGGESDEEDGGWAGFRD